MKPLKGPLNKSFFSNRTTNGCPGSGFSDPGLWSRPVSLLNQNLLKPFILPALAPLLLCIPAAAQQPPAPIIRQLPQAPTLHIESRLVTTALNVTGPHGAPVSGLTANDFILSEDGKPQPIAFFEKESVTPLDIVIAIDASESTFGEKNIERDALRTFVKELVRPQDRVDLISFADQVDEVVPFTSNDHRIDESFGEIKRGSATALYDAVFLAAQRLMQAPITTTTADGAARRVIVLITDGENTVDHGSYPTAVEEAQRAGAMIYSLIIVPVVADAGRDTGGEHALIQMSRDTGGKYYELIDNGDVARALAHVSDDLRAQYTLGYYAPHKPLDDRGLRHIEIELKNPTLRAEDTLRYRSAYYVR